MWAAVAWIPVVLILGDCRSPRSRSEAASCMLRAVSDWDVIVVGAGNAALAAAVSAREQGARRVLALEKAPRSLRGGNTLYSGGLLRIAFDRAEDLRVLVPHAEKEVAGFFAGVEPYPHKLFMADLLRVTDGRTDPELAELLIGRSYDTACWMADRASTWSPRCPCPPSGWETPLNGPQAPSSGPGTKGWGSQPCGSRRPSARASRSDTTRPRCASSRTS